MISCFRGHAALYEVDRSVAIIHPDLAERVWRVRKSQTWIDAKIRDCPQSTDVEIRFSYGGVVVLARRWPSRERAMTHAAEQLRELQLAGWITHW